MRCALKIAILVICGALFVALYAPHSLQVEARLQSVDFNRDIAPILASRCLNCHGAGRQMGGLRLDTKESISGLVTPGRSSASRLLHRITGEGGEARMPLGGDPLSPAEIDLIRRWIDAGAQLPDTLSLSAQRSSPPSHWAFTAPARPPLPAVKDEAWARGPIDRFILARLEDEGLAPSPEAAPATLIRRLYLDLTGLPPSPSEIDEFLRDRRPDAYERLVDRLLASPHYGERWARWWLDAARYADTNGFEKDRPRSIWPYRDWVIKAFNRDLPFDRFTIEQLAGDLLPDAGLEEKIATGFLRNSMRNEEGGVDPEQFRVEGVIDRVDAVGKAFLGLTVACAQCHNHKFDPIAQREYYQFYAFLNSDDEPEIEVPGEDVTRRREEILREVAKIEDELIRQTPDLAARLSEFERRVKREREAWVPLEGAEIFAAFGVKFDRLEDGSFIAKGDNSTSNNYRLTVRTALKNITGFRLELLTDPNLPRQGPGRANDGSLYVSEFSVDAAPAASPGTKTKVELINPKADFERPGFAARNAADGDLKTHWSSDAGPGRRNQNRQIVFATASPVGYDGDTILTIQVAQKFDEVIDSAGGKPNIGRFRISVTTSASGADLERDPLPADLLFRPARERATGIDRELFSYYRATVREWAEANRRIDELMKGWPYGPTTLALARRAIPRETRIFRRGDWKRPEDVVTPGTPSFLHPFPKDAPRDRLGLARWIVDPANPLTARVIVNRVWQHYFGQGLVATAEDFGTRSEAPTHPRLLDYLAVEFRERGWSFKHLHRMIVTSATYRQSSKVTPLHMEKDPTNRWLARAPRLRVEAETVRDVALAASGLLSRKIGGPSVYPPIPDGVLNLGYGRPMDWPVSKGEDRYRRGMYTFWKRAVPYPSLLVFDAPAGDTSCTRRIRSNTPLQALTTLNDAVFMEAAQAMGLRIWREGGATDRAKMIYAFRLSTGRRPDAIELARLMGFLREQQANFAGKTASAVYVSSADLDNLPADIDLHRLAPWTMVARLLLNLDETITRE